MCLFIHHVRIYVYIYIQPTVFPIHPQEYAKIGLGLELQCVLGTSILMANDDPWDNHGQG